VIRCEEVNLFLFPGDMEVYSTIAYYQWSLGRGNQAVNTLRSAIKAYPKNPDAYYNLGLHYSVIKRYDLAEEPLRKSVNLKAYKHNRRTYAHSLEHVGKLDKALAQWDAILIDNPSDDVARNNRDRVRMRIAEKK
jgi:tetratricopeptide (TPR) repeat protein